MPTRLSSNRVERALKLNAVSRGPSVRDVHVRTILHLLRKHNPCSCTDLARYSGLSMPTVASSMKRLEHIGLAKRLGKGSSSGGRPPHLIRFNESYGYVAGIDLNEDLIRVGIANLSGEPLGEITGEIGEKTWPMAVVDRMVALLAELREKLRIPAKRLLLVGVAAPGITDVDAGLVVAVPSMQGWENVPLGRLLEEKIRVQVIVENAANLAALGEHSDGIAQGERNFVFIHVGRDVGAGLFINGEVHHGPEWTAGEIGYLMAGESVHPVRKSQVGTLEAAIGTSGIERQWRELATQNGYAGLEDLGSSAVLDRAAQGDPLAQQIVDKSANYLAIVCSYLSLILNCSLIVFGGELGVHPTLLPAISARLEEHDFAHPRLAITQLGDKAELKGALRLALQYVEAVMG